MNAPNISTPTGQQNFPIIPEAFWAEFSATLRQQWNPEVEAWWFDKNNWPKRTELMTNVLVELARAFGCHYDFESWPKVDVSYYDHSAGHDWNKWSREAAIEIENADSWRDEVCKLMEINAGLKVLIAYVDNQTNLNEFLDRLPAVYQSRKYVTKPCNWLFIFGLFGKPDWDFIAIKFDGIMTTSITDNIRIRTAGTHEPIS